MNKTHTFKIEGDDDREYEVYELTVRQIIDLIQDKALEGSLTIDDFQKYFSKMLPLFCNVKLEELLDMRPSEIKVIWDKFSEANSVFFDTARKAGLDSLIGQLKKAIIADFSNLLVSSSKPATPTS
jgi:hypothetical protein